MRTAIVTGANGFIGSALCKELSDTGYEIIAVVKNKTANISSIVHLKNLKIVYSDFAEFKNLADKITDRDIDILYHLAWIGSAGPLRGYADVQLNNVKYTCDTVKACAAIKCKRFVFASSIMEYEIKETMATETTPGINTLYCSAKIAADYMARTIAGCLGIDYVRTVISNIYGPGEISPRLINSSLRKMLNNEHCAFSTGDQMYDFVYITDAAKIFVAVGEKGKANKTYYIGSQEPRPLKEFLLIMRDCVDPDIHIGLGEIPFKGVSLTYNEFDINAVKEDTGVIPTISFQEGIVNTIIWLKEVQR